jgi:hypothetical protein
MKTTLLPGLVLGATLAASPALAEQPAAPAPVGPVALTDAQLDQVVGGDATCENCSGSSASNNENTNANANINDNEASGIELSITDLVNVSLGL